MHHGTIMLPQALKATILLSCASIFLLMLNHWYGQYLTGMMLPIFRSELQWLGDNYSILHFGLARQGYDHVIRLDVSLARFVVVGSHVIAPDPRGHAVVTTLASSVLRPVIFGFVLIAVWPAQRSRQYLWRLVIAAPLLLMLVLLDVPFVLLGEVWELVIAATAPGNFSPLIVWKDFLQGGGRLALALCVSLVAIAVARWISNRRKNNSLSSG